MFYLGLEARQRDNTYSDLQEAINDAQYASRRLLIPIRIFEMLPNNKSQVVEVVEPKDFGRPLYKKTFVE